MGHAMGTNIFSDMIYVRSSVGRKYNGDQSVTMYDWCANPFYGYPGALLIQCVDRERFLLLKGDKTTMYTTLHPIVLCSFLLTPKPELMHSPH